MDQYATKADVANVKDRLRELTEMKDELKRLSFKSGFLAAAAVYKPFEAPSTVNKKEEAAWQQRPSNR